jgi:ribA/ribD-fused uncharacterized protein
MEALISTQVLRDVDELISLAQRDPRAELEIKLLAGQLQTKDVADRIVAAIERVSVGGPVDSHRATFSYVDGLRVTVEGPDSIYKVCSTASFRGIPLQVERKRRYFDAPGIDTKASTDVIDVPDLRMRFTLRHEEPLRKDFSGAPMDPAAHLRIYHRKSWKTSDGLLQIDMSLVKSRTKQHKTFGDVLKQTPMYELEVEVINKEADTKLVRAAMLRVSESLLAAYQQSAFLLTQSDLERYRLEFDALRLRFVNPVTMERRHIVAGRPFNILSGYTVTNKADGERCFLMVSRDRRLLRWSRDGKIAWTGLTATSDAHLGDALDGEYLPDLNLFCIFDVYSFRGKSTLRLPLMTSDSDVTKEPPKSRLGCAHLFVGDMRKDFQVKSAQVPFRIETKMFLAGDGSAMEKAIATLLDTTFEYPTDGLIFTPRASPVAPVADRRGDTWLRVYKWKPASQNSIDFLVTFKTGSTYDPILGQGAVKGTLFVSRSPGTDIVYPCETMTGEYVRPEMPDDLRVLAETRDRAPSPFQPTAPKSPSAYEILIPVSARGVPSDVTGARVEDNTIIECVRDVERGRWKILRTRYDKTYQYRVKGEPQFGNDINTAESIWTNIHNPVTEEMLRLIISSPPSDTSEDELYYRDSLEASNRVMRPVMDFHNRIKEDMYRSSIKAGDTLLELAMGRANDLHKWRKTRPSKIVGVDLSSGNLEGSRQGACVRYLKENAKQKMPPALFIVGDMSQPLMEQDNRYLRILDKREPAQTPYLAQFAGLTEFDVVSCQMAIHYACKTEETFRTFVGNLTRHGKGLFFGTCMDGQAVYSLLLGKSGHIFRQDGQVFGEMTKEYADGGGWTEEFGKTIVVKLESFEKPETEYLVPFGKMTEILKENNFELMRSTLFSDNYASQTQSVLTSDLQTFSFLHRGFVFRRVAPAKKPEPEEPVQEVVVPTVPEEPKPEERKPEEPKPKKKTVKIKVAADAVGPEPVFFFTGNPALNETRFLGNEYEATLQIEGITFPTVEHYFQWSKAKQFGDAASQTKILKTASAKSVKAYGKKIEPFDAEVWAEKALQVMKTGLKAKFMQHPDLLAKLRETGDRPIGEADPRGKYWGIGTSADTSKAKDPTRWPGQNKLGSLLMELRTELKE